MWSGKAGRMARRKTPVDRLGAEIKSILAEYGTEVTENVSDAVKQVTRAGAKALRAESRQKFPNGTGRYAKGWKSKLDTGKRTTQGTIYNEDVPGLPHLLEHGHANRNGGRTPGRAHIKPIEEQIIAEFTKEVQRGI